MFCVLHIQSTLRPFSHLLTCEGQLRLKNASVLIVGVGGLGCPAAAYLAGAGVGTIGLSDGDTVEKSNLHRQILHCTSRVGISKVDSAVRYLKEYVVRLWKCPTTEAMLVSIQTSNTWRIRRIYLRAMRSTYSQDMTSSSTAQIRQLLDISSPMAAFFLASLWFRPQH